MRLFIATVVSLLLFGCPFDSGSNEGLGSTLAQTPQESDITRQLAGGTTLQEDGNSCAGGDCKPGDTTYYGTQTCELLGYRGGQLKCQDCKVDRSDCTAQGFCGDTTVQNSDEACEADQTILCKELPASQQPANASYRHGTAKCNPQTCLWNKGVCQQCAGDISAQEECASGEVKQCSDLAGSSGNGFATCDPTTCRWDKRGCELSFCGDGVLQAQFGEQCDFGHALPNGIGRVLQTAISTILTCVLRQVADGGIVACRGDTNQLNLQELAGKRFRKIAVIGRSLCGIESLDGAFFCQGNSWAVTTPDKPTGNGYVDIANGAYHMCTVDTGNQLACWGVSCPMKSNWCESMGDLGALRVNAVAVGGDSTCYLKTDGSVGCFGEDIEKVVSAAPTGGQYKKLSVGAPAACGILQEAWISSPQGPLQAGDLVCWGANSTTVNDPAQPMLNVGSLSGGPYEDVMVANTFGCARKESGEQTQWECWGNTDDLANALLSDSANVTYATPLPFHSDVGCITKMNGAVLCIGEGENYYSGLPKGFVLGGTSSVQRIVMVPWATFLLGPDGGMAAIGAAMPGSGAIPTTDVLDIAGHIRGVGSTLLGGFCAVISQSPGLAGQLNCWGDSAYEAILGNNIPTENDFVQVVVGADQDVRLLPFACGLRDGDEQNGYKVKCWGENHPAAKAAPDSEETGYVRLATSSKKGVCARKIDGSMLCWGDNAGSHLSVPALLNAGDKFTNQMGGSADGGAQHFFCFIANDTGELSSTKGGYIICSGDNAPTPPAGTDFIQLAVEGRSLCALRLGGEVECVTHPGVSSYFSLHPLWGLQIDQFAIAEESICGLQRNTGLVLCAGRNYRKQAPSWPLSNQDPTTFPAIQCPPNATCRVCNLNCQLQNVP